MTTLRVRSQGSPRAAHARVEGYSKLLQSVHVCLSSAIICYCCPNGHYSALRKHCRPVFRAPERSACPESWCLCALVNTSTISSSPSPAVAAPSGCQCRVGRQAVHLPPMMAHTCAGGDGSLRRRAPLTVHDGDESHTPSICCRNRCTHCLGTQCGP